jgi:mono/diheme cytochrome c family protein
MKLKVITGIGCVIFLVIGMLVSCESDEQIEYNRYYSLGNALYQSHCQNCHGAQGEGLGGLIPPLTDSLFFKTKKENLACLIKNGMKGNIKVNNKLYDGEMLPVDLTPLEIAEVLTYINNSFGNKSGIITGASAEAALKACK